MTFQPLSLRLRRALPMRQSRPDRRTPSRGLATCGLCAALILSACGLVGSGQARPQDPKDRPYRIETVSFAGGPGVTLAGELTMPPSGGPFKAVALISGSGPQDRNESVADHRPFLVLSDYLTRAGYAVLRYDDRGTEESTGSYEDAALPDFADDAAGAFRYLQSRPEIDKTAIGFIGHSEGGEIAPFAAAQVDPAFMVFLAGSGRRTLPDVLATQVADIARAQGVDEDEIAEAKEVIEQASRILARPAPLPEIREELNSYLKSKGLGRSSRQAYLAQYGNRWGVSQATNDPTVSLRALNVPVLALFGEKDLQVAARYEAPVMRSALRHPRSRVETIEGVNHLFQPAETGLPSEYGEIETTILPSVLERIRTWMDAL